MFHNVLEKLKVSFCRVMICRKFQVKYLISEKFFDRCNFHPCVRWFLLKTEVRSYKMLYAAIYTFI